MLCTHIHMYVRINFQNNSSTVGTNAYKALLIKAVGSKHELK